MSDVGAKPKRSRWVTAAIVLATLCAAFWLGSAGYVLWLARTPDFTKTPGAATGLYIGAVSALGFGLVTAVGLRALWRGYVWGAWLIFILHAALAVLMVWDPLFGGEAWDMEDVTFAVIALACALFFVLPPVRRGLRAVSLAKAVTQ